MEHGIQANQLPSHKNRGHRLTGNTEYARIDGDNASFHFPLKVWFENRGKNLTRARLIIMAN